MPKIADATFRGRSGSYEFEVYPLNTTFNAVGAVYIFTKRTVGPSGRGTHEVIDIGHTDSLEAIYIGQTDSLADRIPNHEKWPFVKRSGADCICVHRDDNEESRLEKETDLRAAFATPCNEQ